MEQSNFEKYAPLVLGGLGVLLGISNSKKINTITVKNEKNLSTIAEALNGFEEFKSNAYDNFKILQRDVNKIGHFVGFKGRLGVND